MTKAGTLLQDDRFSPAMHLARLTPLSRPPTTDVEAECRAQAALHPGSAGGCSGGQTGPTVWRRQGGQRWSAWAGWGWVCLSPARAWAGLRAGFIHPHSALSSPQRHNTALQDLLGTRDLRLVVETEDFPITGRNIRLPAFSMVWGACPARGGGWVGAQAAPCRAMPSVSACVPRVGHGGPAAPQGRPGWAGACPGVGGGREAPSQSARARLARQRASRWHRPASRGCAWRM